MASRSVLVIGHSAASRLLSRHIAATCRRKTPHSPGERRRDREEGGGKKLAVCAKGNLMIGEKDLLF
jgi:hypothetical protein